MGPSTPGKLVLGCLNAQVDISRCLWDVKAPLTNYTLQLYGAAYVWCLVVSE